MVKVKKGDLVRLEYTGKAEATGAIFDTTDESVAKKAGIYQQSSIYGPKLAVFGNKTMLQGVEEAIESAHEGIEEEFRISPEKAFGGRHRELVRMLPEKEFAKSGVAPQPGMAISLDGVVARVKSVTSGRVVVDFNHPLAGESVLYSIKVSEVIAEDHKKIAAILSSAEVKGVILDDKKGGFSVKIGKDEKPEKVEIAKKAILSVVPNAVFEEP